MDGPWYTVRMSNTPQEPQNGVKPEWKQLRKKRCLACPGFFQPIRPEQKFCNAKCRSDFHHHGGSYTKLVDKLRKLFREDMRQLETRVSELERQIEELQSRLTARRR